MKLLDLLSDIEVLNISGDTDKNILGICYNSQLASKDFVFIAVNGFKTDGNLFINAAINNGVTVIITDKFHASRKGITFITVSDTRNVLSKISSNFYSNPSKDLNLIGITGTNGKTSVSYISKLIFDEYHSNSCLIGTLGILKNKNSKQLSSNTTPESLELQETFNLLLDDNIKNCIMEVSSHSIELQRISNCEFNTVIFTNLSHEHLDFHETMEDYYQCKKRLFHMNADNSIINIDTPYGKRLSNELSKTNTNYFTYGINNKSDFYASNIDLSNYGSSFTLNTPSYSFNVKSKLPGLYNVYNILAAVACSYINDIPANCIEKALHSIESIPGRFEVINTSLNRKIIIDYAHTPDAFDKLFKTLKIQEFRNLIMVFGCVGERDKLKRPIMGNIALENCDTCILTTDNCRSEDSSTIIDQIISKTDKSNFIKILDRELAIHHAIDISAPDDVILITGKGHENYQIIGNTKFYFNEREIILNHLSSKKPR